MAGTEELKVNLALDSSDFDKGLQKAFSSLNNLGEAMKDFGKGLTKYVTLPMVAAAGVAVKWAAEEEEADARIAASLRNVGLAWKDLQDPIHNYITAAERATGFNDTDLQNSLSGLIQTTGSLGKSMNLLPLAADLARAKQMDLASAAQLVGKVAAGSTSMLARYGIVLKEGATATEALAALQQKFGGASGDFMGTLAGKTANLWNQFQNLAETIGRALMPYAVKLVDALTMLVQVGQRVATAFSNLPTALKSAVVIFLAVVAALGPLIVAAGTVISLLPVLKAGFLFVSGSLLPVIAQVAAFAALATFLAANWRTGVAIVKSTFYGLVLLVVKGFEAVMTAWLKLTSVIPGLGRVSAQAKAELDSLVNGVELRFMDAAEGVTKNARGIGETWDWLKDKAAGLTGALTTLGQAPAGPSGAKTGAMADAMFADWEAYKLKMDEFKGRVTELTTSVNASFNQMAVDMAAALVSGTGDAGQVFFNFLDQMLRQLALFAITELGIFKTLAAAITSFFGNPWLALGVIVAGIAAVSAMKNNFRPMATGGIVTGPTNALVGEAGPEAVIPLSSGRAKGFLDGLGGGGDQTIQVILDGRTIAESTARNLPGVLRLQGSFK